MTYACCLFKPKEHTCEWLHVRVLNMFDTDFRTVGPMRMPYPGFKTPSKFESWKEEVPKASPDFQT